MWESGLPFVMLGAIALFFVLALAVLIILWIALPFSLFGVKGLLREILEEQKRCGVFMKEVKRELEKRDEKGGPEERGG